MQLPDVSEFQTGASAPDWAGIKGVNGGAGICRVGYGAGHLDHMFAANYTGMKTNGYTFMGLYQYLVAGQDPVTQAHAFCSWIGPPSAVHPGTVFICDLEEGSGDQSGRAAEWLTTVDTFYGLDSAPVNMRSWLYSYTSFVASHNLRGIFASPRHTWIAAYQASPPAIGYTLWQSTDGTTGSNITDWPGCGRCDTSVYAGTLPELAAMGWKTGTPPQPQPKPPVTPRKGNDMLIVKVTAPAGNTWTGTRTYLYAGSPGTPVHIVSGGDNTAFSAVLPTVSVTWSQFTTMGGS